MNTRPILIFAFAAFAATAASFASHAQIALFGSYWENIARAASQNDVAQVRALIADNGNPNQTDQELRTGLHYAAMNGNLTIAAILIKAKAKLDPKDKLGNTPLHLAADRGQVDAAQLLLDVGAPVDAENKGGNIEIVQALLAKGASVTKTDFTGRDAAGWAAESRRPAVVQAIRRAQSAKRS
jgi:ankyrin repeat protein